MIPLSLPIQDRRVVLRSFWAVIGIVSGGGLWLLGSLVHVPLAWALGLAAFFAVLAVPFLNENLARRLYHAWNNRIAGSVSKCATAILLRICLFVIFAAVGRTGSRFAFGPKASHTMWLAKKSGDDAGKDLLLWQGTPGWIRSYFSWAFRSGNSWAVVLIPFLVLLRMVSVEQQRTSEGNIYTLF